MGRRYRRYRTSFCGRIDDTLRTSLCIGSWGRRLRYRRNLSPVLQTETVVFLPHNMIITQGQDFVIGVSFGLRGIELGCRALVCHAVETASLAASILFGKLLCVAVLFVFGEKRRRKNLSLSDQSLS